MAEKRSGTHATAPEFCDRCDCLITGVVRWDRHHVFAFCSDACREGTT